MRNASPPRVGALAFALAVGCRAAAPAAVAPSSAAPSAPAPSADPDPPPLAVPGPAAASCRQDADCGNNRCNHAYARCAFPCVTDADCAKGTACTAAVIPTCQARSPSEP